MNNYGYPFIQPESKLPDPKWFIPAVVVFVLLVVWITLAHAEQLHASWYSVESLKKEGTWRYSHGIMANGKSFSDDGLTCACRLYPLGTRLLVRNINNGKEVLVTVTDRIGKRFAQTRVDLSKRAFAQIADLKQGIVCISVERVG